MVSRLEYDTEAEPVKRIVISNTESHILGLIQSDISDFVTSNTMNFFHRFDIDTEIFHYDPSTRLLREDYIEARNRLKNVKVVNDSAERGVKIISDYIKILSKDENEKQWIVLVVQELRKMYASYHIKDSDSDSE